MPADDPDIDGAVLLYRRVHPNFVRFDEVRGCQRLSTGAFQDAELSIAFGDTLNDLGADPASAFAANPGHPIVCFTVSAARAASLGVCRDPKDNEPAHGLVLGKKTGPKKRALAGASAWTVAPDGACVPPYV